MPEMGGVEATQAIRVREAATGQHTTIIAVTAHAMAGDRERYIATGMDGYLSKPIDPATLFAAVEMQEVSGSAVGRPGAASTDPVQLDDLRSRLFEDDDLIAEVIAAFVVDCPGRLAEIRAGVVALDGRAIRSAAHALKGAASNLSARPVAACADDLEQLADAATLDAAAVEVAWARLETEASRLLAVLRSGIVPMRSVEHTQ
jgi:two-component system, sensor histidine kinase and response regulator